MRYVKPVLIPITSGEPAPLCNVGSNAQSPGCTAGPYVGYACASGFENDDCMDGSLARTCYIGNDAFSGSYSRCQTGDIVS